MQNHRRAARGHQGRNLYIPQGAEPSTVEETTSLLSTVADLGGFFTRRRRFS